MSARSERRALYHEHDDNYDPCVSVDVNEYLIDSWPGLTKKQRQSIWTIAQEDDDFDYDPIYDQIDDIIYELAQTDPSIELPEATEEVDTVIEIDVMSYLDDNWPALTAEQKVAINQSIMTDYSNDELDLDGTYDELDTYVVEYAESTDNTIDISSLDETEDKDESE